MVTEDITGEYWIRGVNENEEKLFQLCAGRGVVIGNSWFKRRYIQKYKWVSGVGGSGALMYYVLTEMCVQERLLDVVLRGAAGEKSDNFLVEAKASGGGFGKNGNYV